MPMAPPAGLERLVLEVTPSPITWQTVALVGVVGLVMLGLVWVMNGSSGW